MLNLGISLQVHYIPIYKQNYYKKKYSFKEQNFQESENFYNQEVSLPIYFDLSKRDVYNVCQSLKYLISN